MGSDRGKGTKRKRDSSPDRRPTPGARAQLEQAIPTLTAPGRSTEKISSRWSGGRKQEAPEWCFAAIEQTILSAFGQETQSQEQYAYGIVSELFEIGFLDDVPKALRALPALLGVPSDEVTVVLPGYVDAKRALGSLLTELLQTMRGLPKLDHPGITVRQGGALTLDEVRATIDVDGLIAYGDEVHWRIVYGYTSNGHLLVFDPMGGVTSTQSYAQVHPKMQMTYRAT